MKSEPHEEPPPADPLLSRLLSPLGVYEGGEFFLSERKCRHSIVTRFNPTTKVPGTPSRHGGTQKALPKHEAMLNFKLLPLLAALGLAKIKGEFNSCKRAKAAWIGVDQVADAKNGVCRRRCCDAAGRTLGDWAQHPVHDDSHGIYCVRRR